MTDLAPLELTALRHPLVSALLDGRRALLASLLDGLGSPLHVVLPEVFEENVTVLRETLAEVGADADILFAKKANKADCWIRSAAELGIGVDVSSAPELVKALAGGVPGHRIGVSGPEKDDALRALAVRHGCLVAVDSAGELRRLAQTARRAGSPVRVLLRCRVAGQARSRFGMAREELRVATAMCADLADHVRLCGFSFHLSGYSASERAAAAHEMIDHCLDARRLGVSSARLVDIGGGFPVRYVDPPLWDEFVRRNEPAHYHADKAFEDFYPYGGPTAAEAVRAVMTHRVNGRPSLSDRAAREGIRFVLEPGRALLDQAGFTLYRVKHVDDRRGADGYCVVTVAGSSFSLSEQWFGSDFLPDPVLLDPVLLDPVLLDPVPLDPVPLDPVPLDPVLLPAHPDGEGAPDGGEGVFPACVAGSTCLENDLVTWRKIGFPRPVRRGDHLAYLNTAGYQMDSNESPFHDAPLPLKVVLRTGGGGTPRWRLDGV